MNYFLCDQVSSGAVVCGCNWVVFYFKKKKNKEKKGIVSKLHDLSIHYK